MSFLGSIFGGSSAPQIGPASTPGINTPGYVGSYAGGAYNLGPTSALSSTVGNLQSTFGQAASAFGNLASTVAPGFSQFRQAGLGQLATTQAQNISNLSQNLAQRRVLGSSFANASLSQANADYAQNQANFIAQSYLQELSASQQLIQQQYTAQAEQFSTGLNQMNLEASLASQLSTNASSSMNQIATAQAQLDAQNAQANASGLGKLVGTFLGLGTGGGNTVGGGILSSIGGGISSLLGGSAAAGAGAEAGDLAALALL